VFAAVNGTKYLYPSYAVFASWGVGPDQVVNVDCTALQAMNEGGNMPHKGEDGGLEVPDRRAAEGEDIQSFFKKTRLT
jgi:hypothetical protein